MMQICETGPVDILICALMIGGIGWILYKIAVGKLDDDSDSYP